jgi:hypothetical protein
MTDKPRKRKKWKTLEHLEEPKEVWDMCYQELEMLKDEMTTWRDNQEGTPLEQTRKFEDVSEAATALEDIFQKMENIDGEYFEKYAEYLENVKYLEIRPYGRRPQARWMRASYVGSALRGLVVILKELKETLELLIEEAENKTADKEPDSVEAEEHAKHIKQLQEDLGTCETYMSDLEDISSDLEEIMFPTMF